MSTPTTRAKVVGIGSLFVVILLSGLWMSAGGKPYGTLPFTIHKLAGVAAAVYLALIARKTHQVAPLGPVQIAAIAITAVCFAGTVVAGGLLSVDLNLPAVVLTLHQALPVLTVLSAAGTLYLLLRSGRQGIALGERA